MFQLVFQLVFQNFILFQLQLGTANVRIYSGLLRDANLYLSCTPTVVIGHWLPQGLPASEADEQHAFPAQL